MRRIAFSVCAVACLVASAASAQTASTARGAADFSGIELGPDLGYAFGSTGSYSASGGAFGGHLGYNLQSGPLVGGVEADALWTSLSTSQVGPWSFSENFLGSARAKGGYAFGAILAYGTLGAGWGSTSTTDWFGSHGSTVSGVVFGVGAEYALTRNVSLRAEFLRYQFGDVTLGGLYPYLTQSVNASTNMLRVGGSIHF